MERATTESLTIYMHVHLNYIGKNIRFYGKKKKSINNMGYMKIFKYEQSVMQIKHNHFSLKA